MREVSLGRDDSIEFLKQRTIRTKGGASGPALGIPSTVARSIGHQHYGNEIDPLTTFRVVTFLAHFAPSVASVMVL